jgi:hypothetical protein
MIKISLTVTGLYAIAMLFNASSAHAQSAEQYNRASQAIQICSSAQGALIPECAKLRGTYGAPTLSGGGSGLGALGGLGGGKAGAAAGILGAVMGAANRAQTQAAPPVGPARLNPQDLQNAIAMCVKNAAGNTTAIQACLAIANGGVSPAPRAQQFAPAVGTTEQATAMGIYTAGQSYQACVAANPNNWKACVQSSGLSGGVPIR